MIYTTYIAPTETPVSTVAIKRALLTFDKVYIAAPEDRDFFPSQAFPMAMGMPPVMSFPFGQVRLLGKAPEYDNQFDKVMESVQIARRQGLIDVISTYVPAEKKTAILGAVPLGGYPLNPRFMLWAYRNIARDNQVLLEAVRSDALLLAATDEYISAIAEGGVNSADTQINDDPQLPSIEGPFEREHLRAPLSVVARSRIASAMKSIGYCAAKQMVPFFDHPSYVAIGQSIAARASGVIDKVAELDPHWVLRNKVLAVAHEEYLDEAVLDRMNVDDVLKLRTSVWGDQATRRDDFLTSIAELVRQAPSADTIEQNIREKIRAYRASFEDLERERRTLDFKIRCDLAGAALGVGVAVPGILSQVQNAVGAGALLLAGCLYAVDRIKDYKPVLENLRAVEQQFADNACLGMHNFYSRVGEVTKS